MECDDEFYDKGKYKGKLAAKALTKVLRCVPFGYGFQYYRRSLCKCEVVYVDAEFVMVSAFGRRMC